MWGKKKTKKHLENIWGKEIERFRDFNLISFYHNYKTSKIKDEFVDCKTWEDLNFNSIYSKLDRTISGVGQQFLFHTLHKYEKNESILNNRIQLSELFQKEKNLRESIQIPLLNLTDSGVHFISNIIFGEFPKRTKYPFLFYFMSYLALFATALSFINSMFFLLAIVSLISNIIINKIYTDKIYESFLGLSNLNKLIVAAYSISKIDVYTTQIELLDKLKRKSKLLKRLNKKLGRLVIDKSMLSELALALIEYGNLLFLFDLKAYLHSVQILEEYIVEIREIFETVAELDMIISIASYRKERRNLAVPKFVLKKEISFEKMYHPTVDDAVANSIKGLSKSALITGSNMAGKTTFIKTVGVNLILAQTIYLCNASAITTFPFVVKTSIKREDNIENSKSYFFAEIEAINYFVELAKTNENYLFLIDEIFRGTNTIERLATSTAVLEFLDRDNKALVTTHDIELQYLLKNNFEVFHFSEQVSNGKFFFDYKIANGSASKGNAIKLLEIMKYPTSVTERAKEIALKLKSESL